MNEEIAVLGAGMAGYGAAYQLNEEDVSSITYEKLPHYGGHTSSYTTDTGFLFDDGPHISFTEDEWVRDFLADCVDGEYEVLQANVNNYWQGHWPKHPVQCDLHGLPADLVTDVIKDFFAAYHAEKPENITTFEEWLKASYGDTFAETFPMVYGHKYHTTTADNMSVDWLGPRLYTPDPEEVLNGALTPNSSDVHYIDRFRYPSEGGFLAYLQRFPEFTSIQTDHQVTGINPKERTITFANGKKARHEHIISSIPLPELIPMIKGAPEDVREAASQLACTKCVAVNIGVDREDISDAHWTYFYDHDISFARLSFPHMFSPNNTPPGAGSIQAEVYFSEKYKPLRQEPEELISTVINDLQRCGLLREDDTLLEKNAFLIPYANVIFDLDRAEAVSTVHGFLDEVDIHYCGRYGDWGYMWTDESFLSGQRAAQSVLDQSPSPSSVS